jgi:hypothetical protein
VRRPIANPGFFVELLTSRKLPVGEWCDNIDPGESLESATRIRGASLPRSAAGWAIAAAQ